MALNLIRNSRVFFTTNVNSAGIVQATGFTNLNTFELQVQDGFSFSQNTTSETVTLNEGGAAPIRGQRSFNTALEPVDWSISTYVRPRLEEGGTVTAGPDADDFVAAEEEVLWNALSSSIAIGTAGAGWVKTIGVSPLSTVNFTSSNKHQLQTFGLVIVFEAVAYVIDNCALESATLDFGLDAIASIAWAGKGTTMRQLATTTLADNTGTGIVTMTGGLAGTAKLKVTSAKYIANKLSTMTFSRTTFNGQGAKTYTIALTGGNITIANNLTYLTPANLGVVNSPVTYFTGARAITASVNAYLKTGANETSTLLSDLLSSSATDDENQFAVTVELGGGTNATKLVLDMPTTMVSIPTISSEQVISTTINLMPQAGSTAAYDIEGTNELTVKYYSAA
jgi:hypothetical protein